MCCTEYVLFVQLRVVAFVLRAGVVLWIKNAIAIAIASVFCIVFYRLLMDNNGSTSSAVVLCCASKE
jgi:hypothetical protein